VETWLTIREAPFQRFFQRLLQPSPVKWAQADEKGRSAKKEPNMFSKYEESSVACAIAALALVFASLSVGAALSPLIAA